MAGIPSVITLGSVTADTRVLRLNGPATGGYAEVTVASAGDVNGDGYDDVIVGAPFVSVGARSGAGVATVVFGGEGGFGDVDLANPGARGFRLLGGATGDFSGLTVASAGDVNGDGYDDVIVGAPGDASSNSGPGRAAVIYGGAPGTLADVDLASPGAAGFRVTGNNGLDFLGFSVAAAGDVNGDGVGDLIIGAPGENVASTFNAGVTYVLYGRAGIPADLTAASIGTAANPGLRILGPSDTDFTGASVASAGDVNGDGHDDLLVASRQVSPNGRSGAGATWVVFGGASLPASISLLSLSATAGFRIDGAAASDGSGFSVAPAGDLNGDGFDEIVIGARFADPFGRTDAGAAYVIWGKAAGFGTIDLASLGTAGFRISGATADDRLGVSVSSAGDVNGDGLLDLVVGARDADPGGRNGAGSTYVLYGRASGFADVDLANLGPGGFRIDGPTEDRSGSSVASAGDVDGDGYDDLVIGSRFTFTTGAEGVGIATVVFGEATAAVVRTASAAGGGLFGGDFNDRLTGLGGADRIVGRDGRDSLVGGAGNDTLDGGTGVDTMLGGLGNDTYVVDLATDSVSEAGGSGRDLVLAAVSFTLGNGLDDLTLTGTAATGTGNAGANAITGNAGANTLLGGAANDTLSGLDGNDSLDGGTGNDRLSGGLGNDVYRVDAAGDVVLEAGGAGDDVVFASVTHTLANGVERLVLTGTAANGTGNTLGNRITGNAVANRLTGGAGEDILDGGTGADTLAGGTGNDLYAVDNLGDVVSEAGGNGLDRVVSSVTHTLAVGVENLGLTGTAALAGTGNASRNRLDGNAGANLLSGLAERDVLVGGAGNDTLVGGAGFDRLYGEGGLDVFRYGAAAEGGDIIYGFVAADDGFQVSRGGFGGGLAVGALPAARFTASAAGTSAAPPGTGGFAYDTDSGRLSWDANGSAAGGVTLLATLIGAPTLTAADFAVIA